MSVKASDQSDFTALCELLLDCHFGSGDISLHTIKASADGALRFSLRMSGHYYKPDVVHERLMGQTLSSHDWIFHPDGFTYLHEDDAILYHYTASTGSGLDMAFVHRWLMLKIVPGYWSMDMDDDQDSHINISPLAEGTSGVLTGYSLALYRNASTEAQAQRELGFTAGGVGQQVVANLNAWQPDLIRAAEFAYRETDMRGYIVIQFGIPDLSK